MVCFSFVGEFIEESIEICNHGIMLIEIKQVDLALVCFIGEIHRKPCKSLFIEKGKDVNFEFESIFDFVNELRRNRIFDRI